MNFVFSYRYFLLIALLSLCSNLSWSSENTVKKDTIIAQVVYGNSYLFDQVDSLNTQEIIELRDSLQTSDTPPLEYISQINVLIKIRTMKFDEIYTTIDSLFELDEVPFALINELNRYLSSHQGNLTNFENEQIDTSQYPANYYYHSWNTITPNPYNSKLISSSDSIFELKLIGTQQSPEFIMPVTDKLTSKYGWRNGRMHKGIDMDLQVWDTVVTAFSGMVRVARTYSGYGRVVVVRHFNGLETLYAHLHRIKVKPGQIVSAGELIGLGGSSGHSTGSHLHWEVRFKGSPINPLIFINYTEQTLVNNTLMVVKTKKGYVGYPKGSVFYVVENGDYLYKIAAEYGTTVSKLCKLNGLLRNSRLYVGQKLRVI